MFVKKIGPSGGNRILNDYKRRRKNREGLSIRKKRESREIASENHNGVGAAAAAAAAAAAVAVRSRHKIRNAASCL